MTFFHQIFLTCQRVVDTESREFTKREKKKRGEDKNFLMSGTGVTLAAVDGAGSSGLTPGQHGNPHVYIHIYVCIYVCAYTHSCTCEWTA